MVRGGIHYLKRDIYSYIFRVSYLTLSSWFTILISMYIILSIYVYNIININICREKWIKVLHNFKGDIKCQTKFF